MEWTDKTPEQAGWWWVGLPTERLYIPVKLALNRNGRVVFDDKVRNVIDASSVDVLRTLFGAMWCGPLASPPPLPAVCSACSSPKGKDKPKG